MKFRPTKEELYLSWIEEEIAYSGNKESGNGSRNIRFPIIKSHPKSIWSFKDAVFRIMDAYFTTIATQKNFKSEMISQPYKIIKIINDLDKSDKQTKALSFASPASKRLQNYETPNWLAIYSNKQRILAKVVIHENLHWTKGVHTPDERGLHHLPKSSTIDTMLFVPGRNKDNKNEAKKIQSYLCTELAKVGYNYNIPSVIKNSETRGEELNRGKFSFLNVPKYRKAK